ncbi:fimbrial chaperone protein StbB, partial [Klebsiella pneumoniae]
LTVTVVVNPRIGAGIDISNPQSWYASISNLSVKVNGTSRELNVDMVPPFSSRTFWITGNVSANSLNGTATVTVAKDQGGRRR